jgi:hypothetical protein
MPRKAVLKNAERRIINAPKADYVYLEDKGMNRSKFFRLAVQAHREGKLKL